MNRSDLIPCESMQPTIRTSSPPLYRSPLHCHSHPLPRCCFLPPYSLLPHRSAPSLRSRHSHPTNHPATCSYPLRHLSVSPLVYPHPHPQLEMQVPALSPPHLAACSPAHSSPSRPQPHIPPSRPPHPSASDPALRPLPPSPAAPGIQV